MAAIQKKIVKQGKQNSISRFFHTKSDKDAIAAWGQDLDRILLIFNVRPVIPIGQALNLPSRWSFQSITTGYFWISVVMGRQVRGALIPNINR